MKNVYKVGSVEAIVAEVAAELKGCTFIIYCADDKRFGDISKQLHKSMPDAKKIGTTGFMFHEQGCFEAGISAMGFWDDEVEVFVGTMRKNDQCPIKYLPGLIWSMNLLLEKYKLENSICFEFVTGHEEKVVSTMKIALEASGMRLIGATPGNTTEGEERKVACNGKVLTNSAVFAVIGSKLGKIELFKDNLFRARKNTHIVTKVADDGRKIVEIDERKAVDVYKEELGYTDANLTEGIFKNPISRVVGSEHYITAIGSFNPDKTISTYKNLQVNDMISFMDIDENFKQYTKDSMDRISKAYNIAGMLSINCIFRYRFFEKNAYTKEYAQMMNAVAKNTHWGVVADGEQYIEQHLNQSMLCAIFTKDK